MIKYIWLNLPVKDMSRSMRFYDALGFRLNTNYNNTEHSTSYLIGEYNVCLMLFSEPTFEVVARCDVADTSKGVEALFSIDVESRAELDELTAKAEAAGGKVFGKPSEVQGWMYGSGICDPDGHRWNLLYMDMSRLPDNKG